MPTRLLCWLLFTIAIVLFGDPRPAGAQQVSEEAKRLFKNGVELLQSDPPNYQDAYYQFKLAYEASSSWKVLGNLGLCAFKLERDGEALDYYTRYLEEGGGAVARDEREALERELLVINGNSTVVSLTSTAPDAELVDTRAGTSVPPQSYSFSDGKLELRLRAGNHSLRARDSAGKELERQVVLSPGKPVSHDFDFDAEPEAAPSEMDEPAGAAGGTTDTGGSSGGGLRTVGYVTAGIGAAVLVAGGITGLLAKGKESSALEQCMGNVCAGAAEEDFDSAASMASVTNILLIGGGVAAAAGVSMILFGGPSSSSEAAPRSVNVVPIVAANGGGIFARGRF
ncbi:MAG TPA: hypothetical protein VF989_04925 [Polyangiaceae bacterium]|jgi:hypothetical protein